jgi:hypothetical protein
MNKNHGVFIAIGMSAAGELGDEEKFVADAAEVGVEVFG